MKALKHTVLALLYALYGIYAAGVIVLCFVIGGALVLVLPGLTLRRIVARRGLRLLFLLAAIPYRFDDLERLPDKPCVVIANHRSYLDGLVLIAALPPHFSAVIKQEVAEIPLIGRVLRRVGARFVQREPPMRAARDTLHLLRALRAGESLAIFPEGTFSPDSGLLPFRDGAFFLAAKAGVPVVPVAIRGTSQVLPEDRILLRPARIAVRVFPALAADGADRAAGNRLRDRVETALSTGLKRKAPSYARGTPDYTFYCEAFGGRTLPLAYLDLDLLEHNIRRVIERSGSKHLRLDARVLKCTEVIQRVMRSNMRFHGVKCSTVAEALHLARVNDMVDMLVAYPTVQPGALDAACAAIARGAELTLTVDSIEHLEAISEAATKANATVPLCAEIDMATGLPGLKGAARRSSIRSIGALLQMVQAIDGRAGVRFRGVLTYDTQRNQIAEWLASEDQGSDAQLRARNARRLRTRRRKMVEALRAAGHTDILVNCGGVGGMAFNATDKAVTEITVGAALYGLDPQDHVDMPAAGYAAEIIRRPGTELYACLVDGCTAVMDGQDSRLLPHPYLPPGARLDALAGVGEAQLPVRYTGDLAIGDMIFMHPANADELCERFSRLLLVQDGVVVDAADTYRAQGPGRVNN